MPDEPQFDFLETYIQRILDENGFEALSEQARAQYVPQFVAEAQRRIGVAVLPMLTEESANALAAIVKDEHVNAEQLRSFWEQHVPDFENIVKQTMDAFAVEMRQTLAAMV